MARRGAVSTERSDLKFQISNLRSAFLPAAPLCLILLALSLLPASAQTRKKQTTRAPQGASKQATDKAQPQSEVARLREEYVRLTKEYKKSLEQLLVLYDRDVSRAEDKLKQVQALYEQGLIAKRDVEASEQAVAAAKAKSDETRQQIAKTDTQVAETLVEAEAEEQAAKAAPPKLPGARGRVTHTSAYVRYAGAGLWSLANAWKVQAFFMQKFGRPLPVSAYGQTLTHDRLGWDHRNAMDVPVNPNGAEGQALMAFMRANGIPFTAFSAAIPGSATGPHIHVGMPSHRLASH
jgi:hypothetical protein